MTLTLALVESALQLVPKEIQSHSQIRRYAQRREKDPEEILLDRAFHNAAMIKLAKKDHPVEKMGRPDILHTTLLQVLETPLNWEGQLRVIVHTQDDRIITINPKVRLPKNYVRFVGLIEQLFAEKKVPEEGEPLLSLQRGNLSKLIQNVQPTMVFGFSTLGKRAELRTVADQMSRAKAPLALVGAYPRGHFTEETRRLMEEMYCVEQHSLDAWVVAGRFVYDFECAIGRDNNRVKQAQAM